MKPSRPIFTSSERWGSTVLWLTVSLLGLGLLVASGCSPDRRYQMLSFFFDGVPNPHAVPGAVAVGSGQPGSAAGVAQVLSYVHKPYVENKRNACHSGNLSGFESFQKVGS